MHLVYGLRRLSCSQGEPTPLFAGDFCTLCTPERQKPGHHIESSAHQVHRPPYERGGNAPQEHPITSIGYMACLPTDPHDPLGRLYGIAETGRHYPYNGSRHKGFDNMAGKAS